MSLKRRILKWGLIGLFILAFALWFGFTTFLFSPLEDDYEFDVSTLIPRDVDFYLAKSELEEVFEPDLTLSIAEAWAESERGQALSSHPLYASTLSRIDLAEVRQEVQVALSNLPLEVDPLKLFGGRDVALAGYFQDPERRQNDWAVYGRVNWMGKLGVELLAYPGLLKLEQQGMAVETVEDDEGPVGFALSGGQLQRPLYLRRVQDVVVLATDDVLVQEVSGLLRTRGEDSLGLSAKYADRINVDDREGDELEVFLDYRALSEWKGWSGRYPDVQADTFTPAFLGRLFQSGAINEVMGRVGFGRVLRLDLHATLSSELMTPLQKRLYRMRSLSREDILNDVSRFIPGDAGLFLCGVGDLGDVLSMAREASEPALQTNLDDLVRSVWSYSDSLPLIDDIDSVFAGRFAFCMRDNDYPVAEDDPPNDGRVVPAWGLVLWVEDPAKLDELRNTVRSHQPEFGIQGREPGSGGLFRHQVGAWFVYEYWQPLVPGTGHISDARADTTAGSVFLVGNSHRLVAGMLDGFHNGSAQLSDHPTFRAQVVNSLAAPNVVLWLNPSAMDATWRGMSRDWAATSVSIDWSVERPRIEKLTIKEEIPDAIWGQLTPEQEQQLEMLAQPRLDQFEAEYRAQHGARFLREYQQRIDAWETIDGALISIGMDKSSMDVSARIRYPIEAP